MPVMTKFFVSIWIIFESPPGSLWCPGRLIAKNAYIRCGKKGFRLAILNYAVTAWSRKNNQINPYFFDGSLHSKKLDFSYSCVSLLLIEQVTWTQKNHFPFSARRRSLSENFCFRHKRVCPCPCRRVRQGYNQTAYYGGFWLLEAGALELLDDHCFSLRASMARRTSRKAASSSAKVVHFPYASPRQNDAWVYLNKIWHVVHWYNLWKNKFTKNTPAITPKRRGYYRVLLDVVKE